MPQESRMVCRDFSQSARICNRLRHIYTSPFISSPLSYDHCSLYSVVNQ